MVQVNEMLADLLRRIKNSLDQYQYDNADVLSKIYQRIASTQNLKE